MRGEEAFEIAAAVASISGLAALLILCLLSVVGVWRLFRLTSDTALASSRASQAVEEMARGLTPRREPSPAPAGNLEAADEPGQFSDLRQQAESLIEQQRRLQEMARDMLDTGALEGAPPVAALENMEAVIGRLDTNVSQMAVSLANLIHLLERQSERQ